MPRWDRGSQSSQGTEHSLPVCWKHLPFSIHPDSSLSAPDPTEPLGCTCTHVGPGVLSVASCVYSSVASSVRGCKSSGFQAVSVLSINSTDCGSRGTRSFTCPESGCLASKRVGFRGALVFLLALLCNHCQLTQAREEHKKGKSRNYGSTS